MDFNTMPAYWFWFSYIDFIRFAWGALMVNQFSGPKGDPVWLNGQTVLQHYGLKNFKFHGEAHYTWYTGTVQPWANFGFLCLFFSGFFTLTWATLKYKRYVSR